jgi:hypothetical protein
MDVTKILINPTAKNYANDIKSIEHIINASEYSDEEFEEDGDGFSGFNLCK